MATDVLGEENPRRMTLVPLQIVPRQPTARAIQNEVFSKRQLHSSTLNLTFEPAKVAKSSPVKYWKLRAARCCTWVGLV
jgi:hypothetical protein